MFKRISIILFVILLLSILALWSPWSNWNISILGILGLRNQDKYAGLQLYSVGGEIELKIDNEVVGNVTEEGSPLDIVEIEPGDHLISVRRISEDSAAKYYEFTRMISFTQGINTIIAYELGPSEKFSSGYLIYASPAAQNGKVLLNIRTEPQDASVFINDIEVSKSPILNYELNLSQDYKIKIQKENCEDIEFDLLPEEDKERKLLEGHDLNVEVNLFELPMEVREVNQ